MPVNRPKRSRRRITTPTELPSRSFRSGANAGMRSANKIAKQYEAAVRKAKAQQAREDSSARAARQVSASDAFAPVESAPELDELAALLLERSRLPTAEESLVWDQFAPGDGGAEGQPASEDDDRAPTASEYYSPTRSSYPPRPRTREMSYNRQTRVLRVVYRSGGTYDYFNVPGVIWYRIRQVRSPGRFIDQNIKGNYGYEKTVF